MERIVFAFIGALGFVPALVSQVSAQADPSTPLGTGPLPSWNDGAAKKSIIEFVAKVTKKRGPEFIPAMERIAVFDNDGTLWAEQPFYFQRLFVFDRVRALVSEHPEWKDKQPFKAAIENDMKTLAAAGLPALFEKNDWERVFAFEKN